MRNALGNAGAGRLGNYEHCTFSTRGIGRFRPMEGSNPHIGEIGQPEEVEEERIETIVEKSVLADVLTAMKKSHPYDEVAYDLIKLENF